MENAITSRVAPRLSSSPAGQSGAGQVAKVAGAARQVPTADTKVPMGKAGGGGINEDKYNH